ncbi:hypothetical protein Plhal703r1_c18g0082371 [Plasmopara halstedii]
MLHKNIAKSEVLETNVLGKFSWSVFELFLNKNNPDNLQVPDQALCPLPVIQGQAVPYRGGVVKLTTMSGSKPIRSSWLTSPTCLAVSARVRPTIN